MEIDLIEHLKERHFNFHLYSHVEIVPSENKIVFPLFNLSGVVVGFQTYRPLADKTKKNNPTEGRYYTLAFGETKDERKLAVWGLETFKWNDKFLFVTEGIFDACRVHNLGLPCIAVLSNSPIRLKSWLNTLPCKVITICDNDKAGELLKELSKNSITIKNGKDLGDSSEEEVRELLKEFI
jgi:DNA primase